MAMFSNMLKSAAAVGVLGFVMALGAATPVAAHTYTRCDYDGDRCVRIQCDWDGDECWRQSEYSGTPYYNGRGRWACDADGDDCRWAYGRRDGDDDGAYGSAYGRGDYDSGRSYYQRGYDDDYYDGADAFSFGYHN